MNNSAITTTFNITNGPAFQHCRRVGWTPEKRAFVEANYQRLTNDDMARHIGIDDSRVISYYLSSHGLKRERRFCMKKKFATPEQQELVRKLYPYFGSDIGRMEELADLGPQRMNGIAKKVGVHRLSFWTPEKVEMLRQAAQSDDYAKIAEMSGASIYTLRRAAQYMGFTKAVVKTAEEIKPGKQITMNGRKVTNVIFVRPGINKRNLREKHSYRNNLKVSDVMPSWTRVRTEFLAESYHQRGADKTAEILNVPVQECKRQAYKLNIEKHYPWDKGEKKALIDELAALVSSFGEKNGIREADIYEALKQNSTLSLKRLNKQEKQEKRKKNAC